MKESESNVSFIGKYKIYDKESPRGWAITIMPIKIRIDNFHGFSHIHYSLKGKHVNINVNDKDEAFKIVVNHILNNIEIDKLKLTEELL